MAGIELDEFFLEYQPIISLRNGSVAGFEALLRWRHPRRGVIAPALFMANAERSGALAILAPWVLRQACHAAAQWNRTAGGDTPIAVSINVSVAQLVDSDFSAHVSAAIGHTGLAVDRLWFEITESSATQDVIADGDLVHELRRLGVKVALDGFGEGRASIGCVRRLPLSAVKIDRSLIAAAALTRSGARVLAASTEMAHALGLTVVAAGIEHHDQLQHARELGCDLGQGFYVSAPVGRDAADRMVTPLAAHTTAMFIHLQTAYLPSVPQP